MRSTRSRNVRSLVAATVVAALGIAVLGTGVASGTPNPKRFCQHIRQFAVALPSALVGVQKRRATAAVTLVKKAEPSAPDELSEALKYISSGLDAIATAKSDRARVAIVTKAGGQYASSVSAVRYYESKQCAASTPSSPALPGVQAAGQTACLADAATIRAAEDTFSSVNGTFVSMPDLVAQGFLARVSSYYGEVRVGTPPTGYTLIAVPSGPCADLPVVGS